jgi:hypothetical protein
MYRFIFSALFLVIAINPIAAQDSSTPSSYRASDNTLFILPTGQTIPKGTHQLNSFQLFFMGYNYGVTDRLQVGALAFFPLSATIFRESLSLSVKYNLYSDARFDVSAMGVIMPAIGVTLAVSSATYTVNRTRLHGGLGLGFDIQNPSENSPLVSILGVDHSVSGRTSLMAEFASLASSFIDDASGVLTVGARFHFENGNIDLGGMRPTSTGGDFLAFPFLRGTIEF